MHRTAATFSFTCDRNDRRSSATVSTGRPLGKPIELAQQFRRGVHGDHADPLAGERHGVYAEARAQVDHERARGQLQREFVELGFAGFERGFGASGHPGVDGSQELFVVVGDRVHGLPACCAPAAAARAMPSFFMRCRNVAGFMPSLSAAP